MSGNPSTARSRASGTDTPSRRTLLVFLVVGLLCLILLLWWVLFQVDQTGQMVQVRRAGLEAERYEAAHRLAGRSGLEPGPVEGFPDLYLHVPGAGDAEGVRAGELVVAVRPERFAELEAWHGRKLVMFVSEGTFFVGLLLAGLGLIYLTLRREVELHRRQSNFVAAVTHELKSPLASLRLYLETFLMGRVRDAAAQRRNAETMLSDVERLEGLIENLLDAAKVDEGGGLNLRLEEVCLSEQLGHWLEELRPGVERRSGRLEARLEEGIFARLDLEAFRAVVRNLVDNAVKYGGPKPELSVRLGEAQGKLRLEVEDRGIGLEGQELERIFQRFYRVGDEMVRSIRGTGLGLYLVREIVQAHGGKVWAESGGRGAGTKAVVELPLLEGGEG